MIGGLNLSMDVIMCKSYSKKSLIDFIKTSHMVNCIDLTFTNKSMNFSSFCLIKTALSAINEMAVSLTYPVLQTKIGVLPATI